MEACPGDRLHVSVRGLGISGELVTPIIIGERSGPLALTRGEESCVASERTLMVELKRADRLLVFVPTTPSCWVKAWVESGPGEDE